MLILVDGQALIHRFHHAYGSLSRKRDGQPTGAVYGFSKYMLELLRLNPYASHVAVVFDGKGGSKSRFAMYSDYKANRGPKDARVTSQYPLCDLATKALRVARIQEDGVEADDVIATYARLGREAGVPVRIVSGDKDFMQLLGPGVEMFDHMRHRLVSSKDVHKKFGVPSHLVAHVQALIGDSVDNIPGIEGIGAKTAAALINECGSLEDVLACASEDLISLPCTPRIRAKLVEQAHLARLSLQLATLDDAIPVKWPLESLTRHPLDVGSLLNFYDELEFASLRSKLLEMSHA